MQKGVILRGGDTTSVLHDVRSKAARSISELDFAEEMTDLRLIVWQCARLRGRRPDLVAAILTFTALICLFATFRIGFEKNLLGTVNVNEWGRVRYALSAAITQKKFGVGWFAVDQVIEDSLNQSGFTAAPDILGPLGLSFPENFRNPQLLQSIIDKTLSLDISAPAPDPTRTYPRLRGASGDDPAYSGYAVLSFTLFGVGLPSMYYLYFMLVLLSLLVFVGSYWKNLRAMELLVLATVSLYLIVASDFVSLGGTLDIKDPRFLSTLAAIPVLHIALTLLNRAKRVTFWNYVGISGQSLLFAFAIAVRSSTQWGFIALSCLWLFLVFQQRLLDGGTRLRSLAAWHNPRSVWVIGCVAMILLAGRLTVFALAHPLYRTQNDVYSHTFWQGMLYGLQFNPTWEQRYGASVNHKRLDDLPREVAKIAIAQLSPVEQHQYLTSFNSPTISAVEKFSRIRYFEILRQNPIFVFKTYFGYRAELIGHCLSEFYQSVWAEFSLAKAGIFLSFLYMVAWLVGEIDAAGQQLLCRSAMMAAFFSIIAVVPPWLISAEVDVMVDVFFWSLFAILVAIIAGALVVLAKPQHDRTDVSPI